MPDFHQSFIIEGEFYGSSTRPMERVKEVWLAPRSIGLNCQYCGRAWAQIIVEGAMWQFYVGPCEQCPRAWYSPPGSIWLPFLEDFVKSFPTRVLRREFLLHAKDLSNDLHLESTARATAV